MIENNTRLENRLRSENRLKNEKRLAQLDRHNVEKKLKLKVNTFVHFYITLLFSELVFKILVFKGSNIFSVETISMLLFLIPISVIFYLLSTISKSEKANYIFTLILSFIIAIWFSIEFIFVRIFNTFFCVSLFGLSDQALAFTGSAISGIISNIYGPILFLLPFIILIIFRKKTVYKPIKKNELLIAFILFFISIPTFLGFNYITKNDDHSAYNLMNEVDNNALNIEKLGINLSTYLDIKRIIFGFDVSIDFTQPNNINQAGGSNKPAEIKYDYNNVDIDYDSLISNESNQTIKSMHEYFSNDTGTLKNEYTGLYKDKNLIVIMGESFNTIALDETLTPTLYKLANESFVFNNFYTPVNLSTIGGEFQDLTGLFANLSTLNSNWRKGTNYFPFGLGTVYDKLDYTVNAYHANYGTFQDRNVYLDRMGFKNFKYRGNGLEKLMNCNVWPQSDLDMVDVTYSDWINEDKFMTYYVSVSGHMPYATSGNSMARKNKELVESLDISDDAKGYLAANIELDRAVASLIEKLTEAGKLEDTVIALVADHYPYALDLDTINELSDYKRDGVIEINHSNLIIWNSETKTTPIDKVGSQLDFIPTLYNLFGIDYDSRLFIGKDILSTEPGLAFFTNNSWVSDYGKYFASTQEFVPNEGKEIPENYVQTMNKIVSNKINMSKLIIEKDYYRKVINN